MAMRLKSSAPDWEDAKCLRFPIREDHDPWFHEQEEAMSVCNGTDDGEVCPKREECLIFALLNKENWGVWGGMYTHDRTAMRRWGGEQDTWEWHEATDIDDPDARRFKPEEEEWSSDDQRLPDAA